jgi:membrane protease YdiL (CAAX protease family)
MWVILYLVGLIVVLMALQSVVLLAFKEPLQWTFGANSQQSKSLKMVLKLVLQGSLIGSIFLFPRLVGTDAGTYYLGQLKDGRFGGPLLPPEKFVYFLYGEGIALLLLACIYGIEVAGGWLYYRPRWSVGKSVSKSLLSTLSSFTVVGVEEPFFRGIILRTFLLSGVPWLVAIPLSGILFSAAHFIRKVKTYWPSVGLAVLGLWLGVAYFKTGNLWLSMGLHSGGILSIGVHRCFLNYKGPEWLVGTQTFPIAGLVSIVVMLIGTAITWFIF